MRGHAYIVQYVRSVAVTSDVYEGCVGVFNLVRHIDDHVMPPH